jgi:hypothetical protein
MPARSILPTVPPLVGRLETLWPPPVQSSRSDDRDVAGRILSARSARPVLDLAATQFPGMPSGMLLGMQELTRSRRDADVMQMQVRSDAQMMQRRCRGDAEHAYETSCTAV